MYTGSRVQSRRQYLLNNLEGYSSLPKRSQNLAIKCLFCNNRHRIWPEAKSFNRSWLSHPTVGADNRRFQRMNQALGLFYTNDKYKPGHFSKPYWLTDKGRDVIIGYVSQLDPRELMEVVKGGGLNIDVMGVWNYMNSISDPHKITQCAELIASVPEGDILETKYIQLTCGRKVAVGYNFQNMPRWLRNIALKGWWDYDFKNCHFVIANSFGDFPAIDYYVRNSKQLREELASVTECEISEVKYSLLSLLYGAKRKPTPNSAIYEYLGPEGSKKFVENDFVKSLFEDIDQLLAIIKERLYHYPQIVQVDEHSAAAQYLMMYESNMLEVATMDVKEPIYMFDGFMCRNRQDREKIQSKIRNATQIPVVVKETQIGV